MTVPLRRHVVQGRAGRNPSLQVRRRQPTYWIDRVLRAVLGFPAYLISLLFGFDRYSLLGGRARALWVLSVVIDATAVAVTLGSAFDWWR